MQSAASMLSDRDAALAKVAPLSAQQLRVLNLVSGKVVSTNRSPTASLIQERTAQFNRDLREPGVRVIAPASRCRCARWSH
jgi:hypothetical protein